MHTLKYSLMAAAVAACCSACTHNNGDIGDLFGTWHAESITVDGTPLAQYNDSMFWKFQNDLVCINIPYGYHEAHKSWARYIRQGDVLTIDFGYTADADVQDGGYNNFTPPSVTNLVNGANEMHIVTLTSRSMVLTLGDYTYTFTKQ